MQEARRARKRVGHRIGVYILLAGVLCLLPPRLTRSQDSPPGAEIESPETDTWTLDVLRPKRSWLQRFHIGDWRAALQFGFRWNRQESSSKGTPGVSTEDLEFREQVTLGSGGFVFHPSLLDFGGDVTLGFTQNQNSAPGSDTSSDSGLIGFSATGIFLRDMPLSLFVFGNRNENTFNRGFGGTTRILTENYGTTLRYREGFRRAEVGFRQESLEEKESLIESPEQDEDRQVAFLRASRLGEVSELDLDYDFQDVTDHAFPESSFRSHSARISHGYAFGPYLEKHLSSSASYFSREGTRDRTAVQASESLQWDHTENLSSNYAYNFNFNDEADFRDTRHRGSFNVAHRLWGSLRSQAGIGGGYWEPQDGHVVDYSPNASLEYTRRIPYRGVFSIGGSAAYTVTDQSLGDGELPVFEEPHTVRGFELIILDNPNVVRESILVTDPSGDIYRENVDYRIVDLGERTALERIPTGSWQDGTVIFVEYVFLTSGDLELATLSRSVRLGIDYPWGSFFFRRSASDTDQRKGDPGAFFEDITEQATGLEFRWLIDLLDFNASAEYHWYDSDTIEYSGPRANQSIVGRPAPRVSVSLNLAQAFNDFSAPQDRETLELSARLSGRWRANRFLNVEIGGGWLNLDDSVSPNESIVDGDIRLHWEIGRLRISPRFAVANRQVGNSSTTGLQATLWMSREFF